MVNEKIREALVKQPNAFPTMIAQELGVSEWAVVSQLTSEVMQEVDAAAFDKIMQEVTNWGEITFIVRNGSVIAEIKGIVPQGTYGRGYFNFAHDVSPISGHINVANLAHICFVQKAAMGMESLSIQFFDKQGDSMFKIYLGRGEDKKHILAQIDAYNKLQASL